MIYLSSHLDSKSNACSQKVKKNHYDYCLIESHLSYQLNLICLERNCTSNRITCVLCSYQLHKNHYIVPIKIFSDKYKEFLNNENKSESLTQIPLEDTKPLSNEIFEKSKELCERRLQVFSDFEINFSKFIETEINSIQDSRSFDENITLIESEKTLTAQTAKKLINDLLSKVKDSSKLDQINKIGFNHSIERDNIAKEIQNRSDLVILFKLFYENSVEKELTKNFNNFLKIKDVPNLLNKYDSLQNKLNYVEEIDIENTENHYLFYPISYTINESKYKFMVFDGVYLKFFNYSSNIFNTLIPNRNFYINEDIDILGFYFIQGNVNIIVQFNENGCLRFWKLITKDQTFQLEFINDLKELPLDRKNLTVFKNFILFGRDKEILLKEIKISNSLISLELFEKFELEEKFDFFCKFPGENCVCFVEGKNLLKLLYFDPTKNHFNYHHLAKFESSCKLINFHYNEQDQFLVNFILNQKDDKIIEVWQSDKKIKEYTVQKKVIFLEQQCGTELVFGESNDSYLLTDRKINFLDLLK